MPRSHGTTVTNLAAELREGILGGRYAPGQRLIEAELTRDLKVSRGPLREAFRRLSAEGLIESIPNRGALVRRLSPRQTQELFEVRIALEMLAAQLAARNIDKGDARTRFEAAIAPIYASDQPRTASTHADENALFHQAVAEASGNAELAALCRQMQLQMAGLAGALTPELLVKSNAEHRAIAKAILGGYAATAGDAMRAHLEREGRMAREVAG
jgi:DNA-binding GntR family transcriptional regulator